MNVDGVSRRDKLGEIREEVGIQGIKNENTSDITAAWRAAEKCVMVQKNSL